MKSGSLSAVIPLLNEKDSLQELHSRLTAVLSSMELPYEIIFVDDGSTDGSTDLLRSLASSDQRVKVIIMSRNFGQHAALASGLSLAAGDAVIWMDADLQDRPEEIPSLLSRLHEGYDVVYAVREHRKDPLFRRWGSSFYFWLFRMCSGFLLPIGMSTFRVMSRRFVEAFRRMGEHSRFTAGMMAWLGFSWAAMPVQHDKRRSGRSAYSLSRLVSLSLDGIFSFTDYPLRLAVTLGSLIAAASILAGLYMLVKKLTVGIIITGYTSIFVAICFFGGMNLFFMGIIGEYIARIFRDVQGRPLYVIKEMLNLGDSSGVGGSS
ncbi:MAG: glycosyltransferase family 2 protein [Vulcanimicrobiota bacterium]